MQTWLSLLCLAAIAAPCATTWRAQAADQSQLVSNLKGQPPVTFKQYAGYVTVNESHGRALFYWFYEADHPEAAKLPLAIWLNGGPGCSSIGNGALGELGPFSVNISGSSLYINKYSWTKAANIIFLESPFGTGFSYSNTTADYLFYDDDIIAADAYAFILNWFKKFPEFQTNDFYLIGESYAGHYIPTLARLIVENNKRSNRFPVNFKGFAIGNPWTYAFDDNLGTTEFYYTHSMISDETYATIFNNCDFAYDLPVDAESKNGTCRHAVDQADKDMQNVDVYNVYGHSCNSNYSSSTFQKKAFSLVAAYSSCIDGITPYLNDPTVQLSLHVNQPRLWSGCSHNIYSHYKRGDIVKSMIPIYQQLLREGLQIWIYSGDVDGVVSTIGTRRWIQRLQLPVEVPWYAWKFTDQVGGWIQQYSGLTFVTVRGAGHMVPANKPEPALLLFKAFLVGELLPSFKSQ